MLRMDQEEGGQGPDLSFSGYRGESANYTAEEVGTYTARVPVMANGHEMFSIYVLDSEGNSDCKQNLNGTSCISSKAVDWLEEQ